MSTNYPTDLDDFTNPQASDSMQTVSHSEQHSDVNDATEALQEKVGADNSVETSSHDYKLSDITGSDKAAPNTATSAAVALNTTHRGSDGKDHSDVVQNTSDVGTNTTAIGLNTTHRGSDGKDHSDVVQNTSDVGTNTTAIGLNTTHRTSDGSDHTFIDQSVVSGATPTFGNDNITEAADKNYITDAEAIVLAATSGNNTGDQVLPVKATGAELDTATDDAKFATAKALKDSKNVPSVVPSTVGNVLTSDGTDWTSQAGGGSGDVVGPASATDNVLAAFDGVTGKLIKDTVIQAPWINQNVSAYSSPDLMTTNLVNTTDKNLVTDAFLANNTGVNTGDQDVVYNTVDNLNNVSTLTNTGYVTVNQLLYFAAGNYAVQIDIDNTKVAGTANLTDFPLLINGTYDGTGYTPDFRTKANGGNIENTTTGGASGNLTIPADLAFYDDGSKTTQYDHEIEYWNATTGELVAWVRIPTLKYNSDTSLFVHYGDITKTTSQENVNGVWDSDYIGVWHFGEGVNGTGVTDSTSNANDADAQGGIGQDVQSLIGYNISQNASNNPYIRIPDSASLDTNGFTFEMFMNASALTNIVIGGRYGVGTMANTPFMLSTDNNPNYEIYVNTGTFARYNTGIPIITGVDTFYAMRYDESAGRTSLWLNNAEAWNTTATTGNLITSVHDLMLGNIGVGSPTEPGGSAPTMDYDEVRFSKIARSDDWLETTDNCNTDPANFYTMGNVPSVTSAYTLQNYPISNSESVYLNKALQTKGVDYTLAYGTNSLNFTSPVTVADSIMIASSSYTKDVLVNSNWRTESDAATITFNLTLGNKQRATLAGNRILALNYVQSGHEFTIKITQDITGSRTVTWWSGISWPGAVVPTLTTTQYKSDTFSFIQTGTNTYDGVIVSQNT